MSNRDESIPGDPLQPAASTGERACLLREQLKKYVGMIQAQRRESSAKTTESAAQMAVTSSGNLTY